MPLVHQMNCKIDLVHIFPVILKDIVVLEISLREVI